MIAHDAQGRHLTAMLFIEAFHEAQKLAPARFLTLRLTPDRYRELCECAEAPEVIQLGVTPGPLGKQVMRVACVKPPAGFEHGIAIEQDAKADPSKLVFEIHRIPEYELTNLAH